MIFPASAVKVNFCVVPGETFSIVPGEQMPPTPQSTVTRRALDEELARLLLLTAELPALLLLTDEELPALLLSADETVSELEEGSALKRTTMS